MSVKNIFFGEVARKKIKSGINKVGETVRVTLGPRARYVVLDKGFGAPELCDDGVTIVKEIELKDKGENLGVEIAKEVAEKTNDIAGDGTTTAILLLCSMVNESLKNVTAGVSPLALKRGLEKGLKATVEKLKKMARQISKKEEIAQVATISANNAEIGNLIAQVVTEVGKDGVVTVEESKKMGVQKEIVKGLQFDRGYISPYFVTDPERMEAVLEEPLILITEKKISTLAEIVPTLEKIVQSGKKDLLIIADDIEGEALATLVVNKLRGILRVVGVKAPGFGDRKKEMLQDIAVLTGGKAITDELGIKLENIRLEYLGKARRIVVEKEKTTIVEGHGQKEEIEGRIRQIRSELERSDSEFDREKLQERLAKLAGGVAVIKVGAATEVEQKAKQRKTEDALNATRAAMEEGVLPGGGVALLRCLPELEALEKSLSDDEEKVGVRILKKALIAPILQIAQNTGMDGSIVLEKVRSGTEAFGFNAETLKFEDLYQAGIIDPMKVVRLALENSLSAASMVLMSEAMVVEEPEEKKGENLPPAMPEDY
ncbi:MAG: chaperonin GroEL [Minisyncoccales bacterium]